MKQYKSWNTTKEKGRKTYPKDDKEKGKERGRRGRRKEEKKRRKIGEKRSRFM